MLKAGPCTSVIKKNSNDLEGWKYAHKKEHADKTRTITHRCPFKYLCACQFQVRILNHPNDKTTFQRHGEHNLYNHAQYKLKGLKISQRAAIKVAVHVNPLEKTTKIRNSLVPVTYPKQRRKRLTDSIR